MQHAGEFAVNPGWRIWLLDLGIRPDAVLRRAGVPGDLFGRDRASLSSADYYRFWEALEVEAEDPTLPIKIGGSIPVEAFDPPIFAALCSPDFLTAAQRISRYKRLMSPQRMGVKVARDRVTVTKEWIEASPQPPASLVAMELVFLVQLGRTATRESSEA